MEGTWLLQKWGPRAGAAGSHASSRAERLPAVEAADRDWFAREVKRALRHVDRPDLLLSSPLLGCRWIPERRSARRAWCLARLLREACESVRDKDGDLRGWEVLDRTYLRPAVKQLAAADDLGMSFGTYRRALTSATDRVVERLWDMQAAASPLWFVRPTKARDDVPSIFRERIASSLRELSEQGCLDDARLEERLREATRIFACSPRDAEVHRVVRATFFHGAGSSQPEIAERLGMPYGSYRRYLTQAVQRIGTVLWHDMGELGVAL